MTTELYLLVFSIMMGFVHVVVASHASSLQRGYGWTASGRDEVKPPLVGVAGRLDRAARNFLETFPFFAAAILMAHAAGHHNWMTVWGAQFYFWARLVYLPLYAFGVPLLRSFVWNVATLGTVLILVGLF
jgi:uncharacterized MAPEG superfamily protein